MFAEVDFEAVGTVDFLHQEVQTLNAGHDFHHHLYQVLLAEEKGFCLCYPLLLVMMCQYHIPHCCHCCCFLPGCVVHLHWTHVSRCQYGKAIHSSHQPMEDIEVAQQILGVAVPDHQDGHEYPAVHSWASCRHQMESQSWKRKILTGEQIPNLEQYQRTSSALGQYDFLIR